MVLITCPSIYNAISRMLKHIVEIYVCFPLLCMLTSNFTNMELCP